MGERWTYRIQQDSDFLFRWRVTVYRDGLQVDYEYALTKRGARRAARRIKKRELNRRSDIEKGVL